MKIKHLLKNKIFLIVTFLILVLCFLELSRIEEISFSSKKIYDRNGILLREIYSSEYGTAYPVELGSLPDHFVDTVIITEDKRFFYHFGIDPIAILRALKQNIKEKRVVSGGSTITQQLVRNMYHYPRTISYKTLEALRAVCIEIRYSKKRILQEYINRIPYGNGAYGIESASRLYFAKPADDLTLAESAFLCAIPSSNKLFNPYRKFPSTLRRQKRILTSMYKKNKINEIEHRITVKENLSLYPKRRRFLTPHFCNWILQRFKDSLPDETKTTLDYNLQRKVEFIVTNHISKLKHANVNNASVVVVDNFNSEILALVGSADFFDDLHSGQVNGALALRQPGSTIKPFVYGLAFESELTASDTLPDIDTSIKIDGGGYFTPRNYDRKFHGMVRVRTALACSYNVATVNLAAKFGPDILLSKLHEAGFESLRQCARFYGPGLCLGSGEVTLVELARAYSGLANGGRLRDLRVLLNEPERDKGIFFSSEVSYLLTDILSDNNARVPAFGEFSPLNLPFRCAVKTGTSKNFRDNWTVGYTPRYTVAVWVGNFSGKPMYSVSGISGAGPIFRDIMLTLEVKNKNCDFVADLYGFEKKLVCSKSGKLPNRYCTELIEEIFINGTSPKEICDIHKPYKIDKRNGLIVAKNCPEQFIEEKVFEIYSPEFYSWVENSGIELPPREISKLPDYTNDKDAVSFYGIEFPKNGDIFKIDPVLRRKYQVITLKPKIDNEIKSVKWFIDNKPVISDHYLRPLGYPFTIGWEIEVGKHSINFVALNKNEKPVKSQNIEITVLP